MWKEETISRFIKHIIKYLSLIDQVSYEIDLQTKIASVLKDWVASYTIQSIGASGVGK